MFLPGLRNDWRSYVFIWIDATEPAAELALHLGMSSEQCPELPEGVDVAWIAHQARTGLGGLATDRLLRTGRDHTSVEVDLTAATGDP
jgi:hypothetical protein